MKLFKSNWELLLVLLGCLLLAGLALGKKQPIQVQVVDVSNSTYENDKNWRSHTGVSSIRVIIADEHVYLDCYKRHACAPLSPGKYEGELSGGDVWINVQIPVTHKWSHDHYKVRGSW